MNEYTPFIDSRLFMGWTESLGHCVFAKELIKEQTFVEIAPAVIFNSSDKIDHNLMNYVVAWEGQLAVVLGWAMLYNHSDDNNCAFSMNYHDRLMAVVAVKDIEAGQQLTVNYGPDWFVSRGLQKLKP